MKTFLFPLRRGGQGLGRILGALGALGVLFLLAGCGGSARTKMDTTELQQAFAAADASVKGPVDEAVKALTAGKLLEGATTLATLAKAADKISDDQKNALINIGATIQTIMSEDGDKADLKVYQAVEDLIANLDGRQPSRVGTNPDLVRPRQPTEQ